MAKQDLNAAEAASNIIVFPVGRAALRPAAAIRTGWMPHELGLTAALLMASLIVAGLGGGGWWLLGLPAGHPRAALARSARQHATFDIVQRV